MNCECVKVQLDLHLHRLLNLTQSFKTSAYSLFHCSIAYKVHFDRPPVGELSRLGKCTNLQTKLLAASCSSKGYTHLLFLGCFQRQRNVPRGHSILLIVQQGLSCNVVLPWISTIVFPLLPISPSTECMDVQHILCQAPTGSHQWFSHPPPCTECSSTALVLRGWVSLACQCLSATQPH